MYGLIIQEDLWRHHGTSGEKTGLNGIPNFSVSDGWWEEGYNGKNGWIIGGQEDYDDKNEQDLQDSRSLYNILENQIIPKYYDRDEQDIPRAWVKMMKESIKSIAPEYSTARMLIDYLDRIYMPLINLYNNNFKNLENVFAYLDWKKEAYNKWSGIQIEEIDKKDNQTIDVEKKLNVKVKVNLNGINKDNAIIQAYLVKINKNNELALEKVYNLNLIEEMQDGWYIYSGDIFVKDGGNFAYTFRVIPKHKMLLDPENMDLYKWLKKD